MEDAVRREVLEETNVQVGAVHYLGSQPWPFPSAMMIGFHAEALSTAIVRNDGELAEAGWFTREQLMLGEIALPPENSIAFRLIEAWFDQGDGPPLATLGLSSSFQSRR
jgi:NAD+ diphosphatase